MASVLLVDDEKYIRKGLHSIISNSGTSFTDIDECSNGYGALQMLSQKNYDVLVTDLVMPLMDGIELLSKIGEFGGRKPYTVILSAHDDFKYAQKAIKYGVKAYLLKPVDRSELVNILRKAESELASKSAAEAAYAAVYADPVADLCESRLSLALLNENLSGEEIRRILDICGLDGQGRGYAIAVANFGDVYEFPEKRDENSAMSSYIKRLIADMGLKGYSLMDGGSNIVVILEKGADVEKLLDAMERTYGKSCVAGLSRSGEDPLRIRETYMQAEYALRCRILNPGAKILDYADCAPPCHTEPVLPVRLIKNLAGMLGTARMDELGKTVARIFDEKIIRSSRLEYLEKLSRTLEEEIIRHLSEYMPHKADFIREKEAEYKHVYKFRDLREYLHNVLNYILNINNTLLRMKQACSHDEIDMAIRHINENYGKDLTMAEVANRTCLNYSYFSMLFKEKTGMNFVDYLKKIRMEKAMDLLRNSQLKICEISGMVGYCNAKHFATAFREFTGISPKEYRERIYV